MQKHNLIGWPQPVESRREREKANSRENELVGRPFTPRLYHSHIDVEELISESIQVV